MQRVLKYDIEPYRKGQIYDWPRPTWEMLAKKLSTRRKRLTMWDITEPIESAAERGVEAEHGSA